MAINRKTQKDVGSFESKLIGPLNKRQTIFTGIAIVLDIITYSLMSGFSADKFTIAILCLLISGPLILIGTIHPYGYPKCEDFLIDYYRYHIQAPGIRRYETHTVLDDMQDSLPDINTSSAVPHKKDKDYPSYL